MRECLSLMRIELIDAARFQHTPQALVDCFGKIHELGLFCGKSSYGPHGPIRFGRETLQVAQDRCEIATT
jgi:hypothetical protein